MSATIVVPFRGVPDERQVLEALHAVVGNDTESDGRIVITVQRKPRPLGYGPGTELKRLLSTFGIAPKPGCKCIARAEEMDRRGCDWCDANINTIVGWLREEATKRGLPFIDAAAAMLVRRAIHNARSKHGTQAKAAEG
jgi:hypothetical protein